LLAHGEQQIRCSKPAWWEIIMSEATAAKRQYRIKEPKGLSPRVQWLRDYFFRGTQRAWNNEFTAFTTGTPWDTQFNELTFYIVPENYLLMQTFVSSFRQAAHPVKLARDFWTGASSSAAPGSSKR
jgi:formate C-acetyltransferase